MKLRRAALLEVPMPNTLPDREHLVKLRRILDQRFSDDELKTLCFDLGVEYDSLPGEGKTSKARELVSYFEHRDSVGELEEVAKQSRPDIDWDVLFPPPAGSSVKEPSDSTGSLPENPYRYPGPIRDPAGFFGRSREVRTALNQLRNVQSVSLVGPRRIGKTSMLRYISNPLTLKKRGISPASFVFVPIDCQQLSNSSRDQLLQLMLNQARTSISKAGFQVDVASCPSMIFSDFSDALGKLTQFGCKLIFLFDEFEYLGQNKNLDPGFFAGLRGIANNLDVAYVTASGSTLLELTYADHDVLGSPFFNIFSTIRIGLLEDSDARSLITEPSRAAGVQFSDSTVDYILSLTDHHPFFIQVACSHAFEIQSQQGSLTQRDYALLRESVEDDLTSHLQYTWDHLTGEEKRILLSLGTAQDNPRNHAIIESVKNQCLICQKDGRWVQLCGLWTEFAESQTQKDVPRAADEEGTISEKSSPSAPPVASDACTVSVQLSSGKQITVEVDGAVQYVSPESNELAMTDEQIEQLNCEVNRFFTGPTDWRAEAKSHGQKLYTDLIDGNKEVRRAFDRASAQRQCHDMHIRFRLPRQYLQLPLELLHDGNDWLALMHPLSKQITGEQVRRHSFLRELRQGEALRVLLVASNVSGDVLIDGARYSLVSIPEADEELEQVRSILQAAIAGANLRPDFLVLPTKEATYENVRRELKTGRYHLFHYSGHASHDGGRPDSSALFFRGSGSGGSIMAMTAAELKLLLQNSDLRFAYFNCCAGATQATITELAHNDFLGIVDAAVQAGIPAVLGMRWPVSDRSARVLACAFYESLFNSRELDTALLSARQEVARDRDDITWLSPVLVVQA
jgi:CHAT domain-containing protein